MIRFLVAILLHAIAVFLTGKIVSGIHVKSYGAAIIAALILAFGNAFVRPILILLTLPLTLLTLGLFILVINAVLFTFALRLVKGIEVEGFFAGFLGWIVYSVLAWIIQALFIAAATASP